MKKDTKLYHRIGVISLNEYLKQIKHICPILKINFVRNDNDL